MFVYYVCKKPRTNQVEPITKQQKESVTLTPENDKDNSKKNLVKKDMSYKTNENINRNSLSNTPLNSTPNQLSNTALNFTHNPSSRNSANVVSDIRLPKNIVNIGKKTALPSHMRNIDEFEIQNENKNSIGKLKSDSQKIYHKALSLIGVKSDKPNFSEDVSPKVINNKSMGIEKNSTEITFEPVSN